MPLKPPNLYPSLRVIFGGKGYPLIGVFIQENDVFVYFSDEMGENIYLSTVKLQNYTPYLGIFRQNHTPCLGIFFFFCKKVTHLSGTPPYTLLGEYPPPPPLAVGNCPPGELSGYGEFLFYKEMLNVNVISLILLL